MAEPNDRNRARVSTGVPGLDDVLAGGLPPYRIYLVQGDPGVGKTTVGLQFLLEGADRGEPVLYVTLSETGEEVRAVANSHGWSLAKVALYELAAMDPSFGSDENTVFVPEEVELHETMRTILAEIERVQPRRVVFDSLSELRLLSQTPLRYRRQILALKQYFAGRECTVLLLDEATRDGGDIQVQSIAHGVLNIEQLTPEYGAERRRLRVLKLRGSTFRGGYHGLGIVRGGLRVFPRLVAAEHRVQFSDQPMSSGNAGLDALLGGGLDRGTSTVLLGPAGSGKSTIAVGYAVAAARGGEHAAIFSFEEGLGTLFTRAKALGMSLAPLVDTGHLSVQQVDPAELSPGEFVHAVREAVEKRNARVIVIDSLNGFLNAMPGERHLNIQLHELLAYLNQKGVVTVLVVAQHGVFGDGAAVDISYLADGAIAVRFFEAGGAVKKSISVIKKRSGRHEDTIRELNIGVDGIHVGPPLTHFRGVLSGIPIYVGKEATLLASP